MSISMQSADLAQPLWCVTGFQSSVPCIRPDQSLSMMSWLETQAKSRGERRLRMPQGLTSVSLSSISSMSCPSRLSACLTASRLSSVRFSTAMGKSRLSLVRFSTAMGKSRLSPVRFSTAMGKMGLLNHDRCRLSSVRFLTTMGKMGLLSVDRVKQGKHWEVLHCMSSSVRLSTAIGKTDLLSRDRVRQALGRFAVHVFLLVHALHR